MPTNKWRCLRIPVTTHVCMKTTPLEGEAEVVAAVQDSGGEEGHCLRLLSHADCFPQQECPIGPAKRSASMNYEPNVLT